VKRLEGAGPERGEEYRWPAALTFAATAPGPISGVVVDGQGAPLANALVLYRSIPVRATAADGRRVSVGTVVGAGVKTGADGSFAVSGLEPASYGLCAYGSKESHLGTCDWGQGTVQVNVTSGQAIQLRFQVVEGTILTFQVQDPKQQIRDGADLR
jgi:hypothetical protein